MPRPVEKRPPVLRALLILAAPMILARATQAVDGFADAYQVSSLGNSAISATATGALNTFGFVMLPMGAVFIVQSFVAQLRGKGDLSSTPRFAWYGLLFALVAGVLAAAAIPAIPALLGLFDFEPQVRSQMASYMEIRAVSIGLVIGVEALGNWYGGLGRTSLQMHAGLISMIVNVLFNWVFIQGRLGMPALGVSGAALSSVVASAAAFAYLFVRFWRSGRHVGRDHAPAGRRAPLSLREFRRVLRFGLPNGLNWFFEFAAFQLFVNIVMSGLGTPSLAAFNVMLSINSVSFMPAFGLASAGAILAGEAIGRGDKDVVWPQLRMTVVTCALWMGVIGAVYVAAPRAILGLFASGASDHVAGAAMVEAGITMLMISAAWQLFDAVGITFGETLRAAGDTAWCAGARILLAWGGFLPVAWFTVIRHDGGAVAAMICLAGYIALLSGVLALRFRSGRWRHIQLIEPTLV